MANDTADWPSNLFQESLELSENRRDEMGTGDRDNSCRLKRIEIPLFMGGNPDGWIMQVGQFFSFYHMSEVEKLEAIVVSMKGDALFWYQWEVQQGEIEETNLVEVQQV